MFEINFQRSKLLKRLFIECKLQKGSFRNHSVIILSLSPALRLGDKCFRSSAGGDCQGAWSQSGNHSDHCHAQEQTGHRHRQDQACQCGGQVHTQWASFIKHQHNRLPCKLWNNIAQTAWENNPNCIFSWKTTQISSSIGLLQKQMFCHWCHFVKCLCQLLQYVKLFIVYKHILLNLVS